MTIALAYEKVAHLLGCLPRTSRERDASVAHSANTGRIAELREYWAVIADLETVEYDCA